MLKISEGHLIKPRTARRAGWRTLAGALATSLFLPAIVTGLFAQDNPSPAPASTPPSQTLSSNRFLFLLDISGPMRRHIPDIMDVEETILRSAASGQLHRGDTIGVWTFNEDIHTGGMPLQIWSADDGEEITLRIAEFIRQQDYGRKSRLDLVMSPVSAVVKSSDILTVFIISSGAGPIHGTPFDNDINAQYELCLRDMGNKPMPLVTVLQSKHGKIIRYTVTAMPWPVVIPELPIPMKLAGEKPAAPAPAPAAAAPVASAMSNAPVAANPAPTATTAPAAPMSPPDTQSTAPPLVLPPALVVAHPTPPPVQPLPAPVVVVANAPVPPAPSSEPVVHPATSDQLPLVPPRQPPLVQKTLPATGVMAMRPEPVVPPAATPATEAATQSPAPAATQPAPTVASSVPAVTPAQPPQKSLVSQATALIGAHRNVLLIGGISLVVIASALIVLMARRSRPSAHVSLITQILKDQGR